MFLTATALPLLVALSEIGLASGAMLPENAAALVERVCSQSSCLPPSPSGLRDAEPPSRCADRPAAENGSPGYRQTAKTVDFNHGFMRDIAERRLASGSDVRVSEWSVRWQ